MGKISDIGKLIAKGVGFLIKHKETVKDVADVAVGTAEAVSNMRSNRRGSEQLDTLEEAVAQLGQGVAELAQQTEEKLLALEASTEKNTTDLAAIREEMSQRMQSLEDALLRLDAEQIAYQKKLNARILTVSICGTIGILAAAVLAIVL
jgi:Skp family chaperone for outer membrane proteins